MNKLSILAILSVFLAAMPVLSTPRVHAQTGVVCIVSSLPTTSCPTAPPSLPVSGGSSLTVALFISGSGSLGGAKLSVKTDPTILNPVAISFTGTVVPSPLINLIDCINGVPVAGSGGSCQAGIDGVGVASLGMISLAAFTVAPTSGLLFTVTYNVLSTRQTGIDVLINSGCAGSSVTGTNDCILISSGAAVVPETALVGATVAGVTDPNALAIEGLPTAAMNTLTSVVCRPSSISISGISTCTATVVDPTTPSNTPIGTVSFVSSNTAVGTVGAACTLVSGSCSVAFTGVSFGTATVTGTYSGDASHSGSSGTSNTITVVKDNTSTSVVCSSATIVPDGTSTCTATVTDTTNAANTPTGSVTFTSSNTTVVTGGSSCTLLVGSCSVTFTGVAPGTSSVTGAYGGDMIHLASSGTFNTVSVLSPVVFSGAKLSWTHHLSLSKTTCSCETWTAKITNPNLITVYAQITVVATDGSGTTGFTTTSAVIALAAGATMAPMILSPNLSGDIGVKFHFTATIMWGRLPTALTNPGGNMKTGSFAVVA